MDTLSPYQQKLGSTHVVPIQSTNRRRPMSATVRRRDGSRDRTRRGSDDDDDDDIDDDDYSDRQPSRPMSAPVHKR